MAGNTTKKTKGRQKIELKKIENEEDKLITFSKRRSGINKKASELVTLTGAQIAFVVYSPAGKPFSFAHPSMEAVVNRFLQDEQGGGVPVPDDTTHPLLEAHRLMRIVELNKQHNELLEQVDVEKAKTEELKQQMRGVDRKEWWDTPVEEMNVEKLIEMEASLKTTQMELINNMRERIGDGAFGGSSSSTNVVPHQVQVQPEPEPQLQPFPDEQPYHMFNPFDFNLNEQLDFPSNNYSDWPGQM